MSDRSVSGESAQLTADLTVDHWSDERVGRLLREAGFQDWRSASRRLARIVAQAREPAASTPLLPFLLAALSDVPNPDYVLVTLERFLQHAASSPHRADRLLTQPRAIEILVKLFAGSQFLAEILLRNPEYLAMLLAHRQLTQPKTLAQFTALNADETAEDAATPGSVAVLCRYQRWEILRIGACDLLGLLDLSAVTAQLSALADHLIHTGLELASRQTGIATSGFAVLAMGKLGGRELNYSSDIDLLFISAAEAERYRPLGERLIDILSRVTEDGFLYRVDMRLRPWGRTGPLVISLPGYINYLQRHARVWEKQALLKARPVAGDRALGDECLRRMAPLIFAIPAETARQSVQRVKRMTEGYLVQQGRTWGEVKLGKGSIRDIEFVVQYLQLAHGAEMRAIRTPNTLEALAALSEHGILGPQESRVLQEGYTFLRTLEHCLQLANDRQIHTLPDAPSDLQQVAQRMGFEGPNAAEAFLTRYDEHRAAVRAIYLKYLEAQEERTTMTEVQAENLSERHVARMDESYTTVFSPAEIRRHAILASRLDAQNQTEVTATELEDGRWRVTLVGYDYPGELSLICGLLFVYGLSIDEGHVFTYEPAEPVRTQEQRKRERRKIVDVFTVHPLHGQITQETWLRYADDLAELLRLMQRGQAEQARGQLAKRVASAIQHASEEGEPALYPVEIEIDNESSPHYTVLHISAPDTIGFLYEITNALAYSHIYIARVSVTSRGSHAYDNLFVTDAHGQKIKDPGKLRELRAAIALIKHFTHLLPKTPDPETALLHFREFIHELFRQPNWPDELASLERPDVLEALARLLGVSEFLWDDFLRMQYANLFPIVRDTQALQTMKTKAQLQAQLEALLAEVHPGPQSPEAHSQWRQALNDFKDREMFRIDMRHILGYTEEFWDFSEELTSLAEVVVNAAYHLCHEDLRSVYGDPLLENGELSDMTVLALGKCGGRELGFASDIELMFVYSGNGRTTGPKVIATSEFYERLVRLFLQVIRAKREGIFEIDLQLRPYGKSGSVAVSLDAFRRYFAPDGPAWPYERQALVKLRPIAGCPQLGEAVAALRDAFVYSGEPFDIAAMRAMRERQLRYLVAGGTFNAKYSPGGLVDVEYLVQALQITHGAQDPTVRSTNIREAMAALAAGGYLSQEDYTQLRRAHTFLRWLIDGLRMVRGNARDLTVPPPESEAFAFLARRLRYGHNVARLEEDLQRYTTAVQSLNRRLLG